RERARCRSAGATRAAAGGAARPGCPGRRGGTWYHGAGGRRPGGHGRETAGPGREDRAGGTLGPGRRRDGADGTTARQPRGSAMVGAFGTRATVNVATLRRRSHRRPRRARLRRFATHR